MKARTPDPRVRFLASALALGLAASCARPPPAAPENAGSAGDRSGSEGVTPTRPITSADVEAYVRYRGALGRVPPPERARAEERAMKAAGLTEDELDAVEPVVLEVMGRLQLVKVSQVEETLKTYEQVRAALPVDQQQTLSPTLTALRERRDRLESLASSRQRYGNTAVEAVLQHQDQLKGLSPLGK